MKTFRFALIALVATTASAGVRIETVNRDIKTKAIDGLPQVLLVQDGKVRMNGSQSGAMILKGGVIYMLDDKRKAYREMDKATMKATMDQAGAQMKMMQERMKNMPPEQRAQMEKMMGGAMPGMPSGKPKVYTSKDTGKSDSSEGRKCRVWHLLADGEVYEELCVVPFSTFPGKEDFEKTFKEIGEAFSGLASGFPGAGDQVKARSTVNGYPVRVRPYVNGQPRGTEIVLKSWTEESVPASSFEIPAGYKKRDMPSMGPMGPGGG
jgi:hypothetical protein